MQKTLIKVQSLRLVPPMKPTGFKSEQSIFWKFMKLTCFLLLGFLMHVSATGTSQQISVDIKNGKFTEVMQAISQQTEYAVFGNAKFLNEIRNVNIIAKNESLDAFLSRLMQQVAVEYEIDSKNKNILFYPKTIVHHNAAADELAIFINFPITGKIVDAEGEPIVNVSVKIKGTRKGTTSDGAGQFKLQVNEGDVLEITSIGYTATNYKVKAGEKELLIVLEKALGDLSEVVINTGILNRNKNSFTGAVSVYSGSDLKAIGNRNVLQSLKTLDPSFIMEPSLQYGSNPNQLPTIELRGKTSVSPQTARDQFTTDPNQPLFILNGMEATLQQINDLDINRVETITILKDAASTAMYGSKAANGVVVIETLRLKNGALSIYYNNDSRWETADLSGYDMMNSFELLEFQKLSGLYSNLGFNYLRDDERLYNQRLMEANRGVNTYWLNVPVKPSFSMSHSLNLYGGSDDWSYGLSMSHKTTNGVMIGSDRKTWSAGVDLGYRKSNINVINTLYISGLNSNESPYGSFKQYVSIPSYYRKTKPDGTINNDMFLEEFLPSSTVGETPVRVKNPLYNAGLNQLNNTTNLTLQNRLQVNWDFHNNWRLSGSLALGNDHATVKFFRPAEDTYYETTPIREKGLYSQTNRNNWNYQSNLMLTFKKVLNELHSINGNLRGEVQENNSIFMLSEATGFPLAVQPNPAFAFSYRPNSRPSYTEVTSRQTNALISVNYAFDNKFFADATFRTDGSTVFGSAKKYSPFWSVGAGWQLSKEPFLSNLTSVKDLKLTINTGTTGNQQLGSFSSTSIFQLENDRNIFGQGYYLSALGNENLEWQKTRVTNIGLSFATWENRINTSINFYQKETNPLIVAGVALPSTGVKSFPFNVGSLANKGVEVTLRAYVLKNDAQGVNWIIGVTGARNTNKYSGLEDKLKNLNDAAQKLGTDLQADAGSNFGPDQIEWSMLRYKDGFSADDLWAVKSAGIDPATGREVFLSKDGLKTFNYNPRDIVVVGNGRPDVQGVISSNLTIKNFRLNLNIRYSLNKDQFNSALYQRVENISTAELSSNLDRRALTQRWAKVGDLSQYKRIGLFSSAPMSSRFVQSESYISGESISASYELQSSTTQWLAAAKISSVRFSLYMNDIFRLSNITIERGVEYPFTRSVAGSIAISF